MAAKYHVYRNLNAGAFSLRLKGIVQERSDIYMLHDVEMKVSQAGRARVLKQKRKNVHATLAADRVEKIDRATAEQLRDQGQHIYYDPYITEEFTLSGAAIMAAKTVLCIDNRAYLIEV